MHVGLTFWSNAYDQVCGFIHSFFSMLDYH